MCDTAASELCLGEMMFCENRHGNSETTLTWGMAVRQIHQKYLGSSECFLCFLLSNSESSAIECCVSPYVTTSLMRSITQIHPIYFKNLSKFSDLTQRPIRPRCISVQVRHSLVHPIGPFQTLLIMNAKYPHYASYLCFYRHVC